MSNQLGIVHPKLLTRLQPNHYAGACTIQQATETPDVYGAISQTWANLTEHVNLACRVAPDNSRNQEQSTEAQLQAAATFVVALAGYYPGITEKMRAIVGSATHEIQAVEHDGQSKTTRLLTQIVR